MSTLGSCLKNHLIKNLPMLNSLRTSATSIWAKILLAFLVLSFGVWGIGDVVTSNGRNAAMATVGAKTITGAEFRRALQHEAENIRRVMGDGFTPAMLKNPMIYRHVVRQMVNNSLLLQESEVLGLIPSDADVVRRIRSSQNFQDNKGNFNKVLFENMLKHSNISEKTYVESLREEMAVSLLIETLVALPPVSDTAAQTLLEAREEGRNVTFYSLKPSLVSNVPQPDNAQIKSYYESHNKDFTAPEYRTISYVTITSASVKNGAVSEDDLKALYKERIDDYKRPERRKVEQVLYSSEDSVRKAAELLKSGKPFDRVAKETDALNKDNLLLGNVEQRNILENAADAVFSLKVGAVTDPIQSAFGWHIFRVTAIEPPSVAPLDEVRPALEKELKQRNADDGLNKLANQIQDALAGGTPLQEAAKEFGLKVTAFGPVDRQGKTLENAKSSEVPELDNFLDVAFKTDEKTESSITTSKNGVFYIVRVDKTIPERLRTLDEIKGLVVSGWQKEEREKRLSVLAKEIGDKFTKQSDRDAAIAKYNLQPVSTTMIKRGTHAAGDLSLPPPLVADIFARQPQQGSAAYLGKNGDYLLGIVSAIVPAGTADKDPRLATSLADIKTKLKTNGQNEVLQQYTQYLEKKYPVSIHESVIEAVLK